MKKGQTIIIEQVLLFMISVAIFIACFGLFQLYQAHFLYTSLDDQANAVRDVVTSHIIELVRFGEFNASVELNLPKRISNGLYTLSITDDFLNVTPTQTGVISISNLYEMGAGSYSFSGEAASSAGEIIIYKRGHNIIIGSAGS